MYTNESKILVMTYYSMHKKVFGQSVHHSVILQTSNPEYPNFVCKL